MNRIDSVRLALDKNKLWSEIQTRDPRLAAFLKLVTKTFGKPASVAVMFLEDA